MTEQPLEGIPRYSLKTLHALYDGATRGSSASRGEPRVTVTTKDNHHFTGTITSIGIRLGVLEDNGTAHEGIKASWVQHAEVV